jgi:hypothetical protein
MVNGEDRVATCAGAGKLPAIVEAFEKAKKATSKAEIVTLINDCDLPREAIPTRWLNEAAGVNRSASSSLTSIRDAGGRAQRQPPKSYPPR